MRWRWIGERTSGMFSLAELLSDMKRQRALQVAVDPIARNGGFRDALRGLIEADVTAAVFIVVLSLIGDLHELAEV
jgi:hypothetical protein